MPPVISQHCGSCALWLAALVCALTPTMASAMPTVRYTTTFSPNRLGAATTVGFAFKIGTTNGSLPPPLRRVDVRLPPGLVFITSTLGAGLFCNPEVLVVEGPEACPINARIGLGNALVKVPIGPVILSEEAAVTVLMGEPNSNYIEVLFYAEGTSPVEAQLVFPAEMYLETGPQGSRINTALPLIPSLPEAPDVSVVSFRVAIGPRGLTYYKRHHGRVVAYAPTGMTIPTRCPWTGFRFLAAFDFQGGAHVTASSRVPCPSRRSTHRKAR
jgi:hypothetical protein